MKSWHDEWAEPPSRFVDDAVLEWQSDSQGKGSWEDFYQRATQSSEIFLIKTHRPPRDDQPAIYIMRDGRKTCLSYSFFHRAFTPQLPPSLLDIVIGHDFYGGWSEHFQSWTARKSTYLVCYEDLVNVSPDLLQDLASWVGYSGDIAPWQNPFHQLHRLSPDFFRQYEVDWRGDPEWTPFINSVFFYLHGELMVEHGYATAESVDEIKQGVPEEWLQLMTVSRRLLQEKRQLDSICADRKQVIDDLDKASALHPKPTVKNAPLSASQALTRMPNKRGLANSESKESLNNQLIAKESVIQQQRRALAAYRSFFFMFAPILKPLNFVVRHGVAALKPRLGKLVQYPPREIKLAPHFQPNIPVTMAPSIAIVTPSYNQGGFIERTLRSVLNQGYPNLEFFVQDGGSSDDTVAILQRYSDQLSGWESLSDQGQSHAINLGFGKTSGQIMAWLNSDDILLPGTLAYVANYFLQNPDVDVVYGHRILIDEQDQEIGRWILPAHNNDILSWVDFVPQETLFWRRALWEKIGGQIDENFRFAMDWDLLLRFRKAGARMVRLPRLLGGFRIHDAQKTSDILHDVGMLEMDILRRRELGRQASRSEIHRAIVPYLFRHIALELAHRIRLKFGDAK